MQISTDGFVFGEEVQYKRFSQGGRFLGVRVYKVVEVRQYPAGTSGAVGQDAKGRRIWLYANQRA